MNKLKDGIKTATDSAKGGLAKVSQTARNTAKKAKEQSSGTIDKNPMAILLGGLALGAIVGALLPKSEREKKMFGAAGKKLNRKAKEVASAAKQAGIDKVDQLGINKDTARAQFRDLVDKASEAVKAAGKAAGDAARKKD